MITAHGSTEIRAPIETVFDFLADARNEPAWLPGAQQVELQTPGPVGDGARFEGVYARAGRVQVELVDVERPHRLTFRATARMLDFDDIVSLEERDGVTTVTARMEAQPKGLMRLFARPMAKTLQAQFAANWVHLKDALEREG